jgi:hypothetical protein
MIGPLFAMPPPSWGLSFATGLLVVFVASTVFVRASASGKNERNRRAGLGLLAIIGGPLIGLSLAGLVHAVGGIHPLDIGYTYGTFAMIGGVAGLIAGLIFAVTGILSSNKI